MILVAGEEVRRFRHQPPGQVATGCLVSPQEADASLPGRRLDDLVGLAQGSKDALKRPVLIANGKGRAEPLPGPRRLIFSYGATGVPSSLT